MWTIIKGGKQLPDDFIDEKGLINHRDYVIEMGKKNEDWWVDELKTGMLTLEMIGAIIIGSKNYNDLRFRQRTPSDNLWDKFKTLEYKIMNNNLLDKIL